MNYEFPQNFWWGSAISGPQTEGRIAGDGKGDRIWDHWYREQPDLFFDQVGPSETSEVYTRYKEDIALMKATGHNYRVQFHAYLYPMESPDSRWYWSS